MRHGQKLGMPRGPRVFQPGLYPVDHGSQTPGGMTENHPWSSSKVLIQGWALKTLVQEVKGRAWEGFDAPRAPRRRCPQVWNSCSSTRSNPC